MNKTSVSGVAGLMNKMCDQLNVYKYKLKYQCYVMSRKYFDNNYTEENTDTLDRRQEFHDVTTGCSIVYIL